MKDSIIYIQKKLIDLHKKLDVKIKYEFKKSTSTHLVEITPLEQFNSNDYIELEILIQDEFEKLYGFNEDLLFISSDSLNKIGNIQFSLGYDSVKILVSELTYHNFQIGSEFLNELINTSYAQAA